MRQVVKSTRCANFNPEKQGGPGFQGCSKQPSQNLAKVAMETNASNLTKKADNDEGPKAHESSIAI